MSSIQESADGLADYLFHTGVRAVGTNIITAVLENKIYWRHCPETFMCFSINRVIQHNTKAIRVN